ncbi:hypothetical protein D3C87_1780500 [compost metagenome]
MLASLRSPASARRGAGIPGMPMGPRVRSIQVMKIRNPTWPIASVPSAAVWPPSLRSGNAATTATAAVSNAAAGSAASAGQPYCLARIATA